MRLENYPVEKLKKEIIKIIKNNLGAGDYRVFFFGSRVLGTGDEHSDIDIGIENEKEISYKVMSNIKEQIAGLPILYKMEIVDFKKVSEDFREVAFKKIELIK